MLPQRKHKGVCYTNRAVQPACDGKPKKVYDLVFKQLRIVLSKCRKRELKVFQIKLLGHLVESNVL